MSSPVSHYHHVVCGSPQRLDDAGVAGDHDDAGKDEGDDDLVPGEVDSSEGERESKVSSIGRSTVLPNDIIGIVAVGDGDDVRAVGVVVGEHILQTVQSGQVSSSQELTLVQITGMARNMERTQTVVTTFLQLPRVQRDLEW